MRFRLHPRVFVDRAAPRRGRGARVGAVLALLAVAGLMGGPRAAAAPMPPCQDAETARGRQCLRGPVKSVAVQTAKFRQDSGAWVEEEPRPSWVVPSRVYDWRGNLAEERVYEVDGSLRNESVYLYDPSGRLRESLSFGQDSALQTRVTYAYDGRGRRTGEEHFDAEGDSRVRVEYAYDVLGRLIEESVFNERGEFMLRWVYSYNAANRRSREALYTARAMSFPGPVSRSFLYDEEVGRLAEELAFDAAGNLIDRIVYEYDAEGNRAQESRYDPAGFLLGTTAYEYEFDAHGNWIKQTRLKRFGNLSVRPLDVTYRTVTYFDLPGGQTARR